MKKKFIIFLILIFALGLAPLNLSYSITQNQIDAEVQIVCPDNYGNWWSGSGTIIDSKGIILTNKHVVTDEYGSIINTCYIGFMESISQEPDFGTFGNRYLAEVKYYTTSSSMDAAILYLDNPTNESYPYINIWNSDSSTLQFGDKIEVIGFPSIGGSTITYTSGDFSGFGSNSDGTQNYIKTTAPLEHGNSGGAAYKTTDKFIGIPTMVVAGELNSLSYILSVNSIKEWLISTLGNDYQQEVITQESSIKEPTLELQADITPPRLKGFNIGYEVINNHNLKQSFVQYTIPTNEIVEESSIKEVYYYFGENKLADPLLLGKSFEPNATQEIVIPENFLLIEDKELYLVIKLQDEHGNISDSVIAPWEVSYMLTVGRENALYNEAIKDFNGTSNTILSNYSGFFIRNNEIIWWVSPRDKVRYIVYSPELGVSFLSETLDNWLGSMWGGFVVSTGITSSDLKQRPRHIWGHLLIELKDDESGFAEGTECDHGCYINPKNGELIDLGAVVGWGKTGNEYQTGEEALTIIETLVIDVSDNEINYIEPLGTDNLVYYGIQWAKDHNQIPEYGFSIYRDKVDADSQDVGEQDESLDIVNRLKGKILLQVESHGEAWYIPPTESKRYYMKDGPTAYEMLRQFGLGITNSDLAKIPIEGSNQTGDYSLVNRLKGYILLQVEEHGEAWYVNPDDGKRYYMRNGDEAYSIMRFLSLGITNDDLSKIAIGEF